MGDIAEEITLESLLALVPGKLQKQDVVLLIFILKSCSDYIETKINLDDSPDDSSINNLVNAIRESREAIQNKAKESE